VLQIEKQSLPNSAQSPINQYVKTREQSSKKNMQQQKACTVPQKRNSDGNHDTTKYEVYEEHMANNII
jgi:hypothetical protein